MVRCPNLLEVSPVRKESLWWQGLTHKMGKNCSCQVANAADGEEAGRVLVQGQARFIPTQPKGPGKKTRSMEGTGLKYGERGLEHGIRVQWE